MNRSARASIMVIGDNSDFVYLMRRYVRKAAHAFVSAGLGPQALAVARRERPAVIVLEADLVGALCWDVLRALKADQVTCEIPVLVCSWLDEEERSLAEGADVYLRKPILFEDLQAGLADVGIYPRTQPWGG